MVDTRPRQQTLLDRFEHLDAIWPERSEGADRVLTTSSGADDLVSIERGVGFLRYHRWGLIAIGTVVAAGAWLALVAAPGLESRFAREVQTSYDNSLAAIDLAVPDARRALAVLSDPAADSGDLSSSLQNLSPFVAATTEARSAVSAKLPATPPFVPRAKIEALVSSRSEVGVVVDQSEALLARLNTLLTYRLLSDGLFDLPELPASAPADSIDVLSADLASALAASVEITVSLPADPLLADHRSLANATLARIDAWRADYLAALRAEDPATAEAVVGDINTAIGELDASLVTSLTAIEAWGARELDLLRLAALDARSV